MPAADVFPNLASITVVESALNTLTFKKLETGVSFQEKVAWVLHRLEIYPEGWTILNFNHDSDHLDVAIVLNNTITDIMDMSNPAVLCNLQIRIHISGTPANFCWSEEPIIREFSQVPGGGLIFVPNPVYFAAKGTGLAAATTTHCRLYYTTKELKPEEYWELVDARRVLSA